MEGIFVRTVEELEAARLTRSHPNIIIEGELANNLIISGMVSLKSDQRNREGQVSQVKSVNSHLYPVYRILLELSRTHCFEVMDDSGPKRIKMYPRPFCRREGN